jgi:hypothetical protein
VDLEKRHQQGEASFLPEKGGGINFGILPQALMMTQ